MTNFRFFLKNVATGVACFAVALSALTGCGDKHDDPVGSGDIPVNLRTNIEPASVSKSGIAPKVANDQWEANDKVGLFMKRAGQALTAAGAIYSDANNLQMSIDNGSLTVSPTLRYPETGNVDFIAYHPYNANVGANFTIPVNVAGQEAGLPVEVLYSNDVTNQPPTAQPVTLNFQYSLAKVEITVTGGDNSELTEADFAAMTVTVLGLPTQATLHLADGTLTGIGEKQTIALHRKSSNATSATFEMLALPVTNEEVTFIFNVAGMPTLYETTVTYEAAKLYRSTFALNYPEITKLNTYIVPRGEEPPQNISIAAGTKYMTMKTAAEGVSFVLRGTGEAFVDWGDGSPLETFTLTTNNNIYCPHSYTGTTARTITIYGDDITYLDCQERDLIIGYFYLTELDVSKNEALTYLRCDGNQLTELDVSKNTALTSLNCSRNQLTALDVSKNTALQTLQCNNNQLTALDVSNNTALVNLGCFYNQLTELDMGKNEALTYLRCDGNQLTELDVSKNTALTQLICDNNQLTQLDVSKNIALTSLSCSHNQLTELDVSKNTALETLFFPTNQLTELDVSKNTALTRLNCGNNQLTELDVSKNIALEDLDCGSNQLSALDVSNNTALTSLWCDRNQLTELDVSNNTTLSMLNCNYNQLTELDVSNNTFLWRISCTSNLFTNTALNYLFGTLHSNNYSQTIYIRNNPGTSNCDASIATAKGWVVNTTADWW